ncbi:MAG: HDOD domain-containing protein [Calditrichia bacterium]
MKFQDENTGIISSGIQQEIPPQIEQRLRRVENLATLPAVIPEILEKVRSSSSSMKEIAAIIERDASITTKILKVSNSPLWGYPGRVENIRKAIILLGLKEVTNIVLSVSLYSTFAKFKPNSLFEREKFWLHCAGTGQIARALSAKLRLNFEGEEFVAALIHDIGKMILDQYFTSEFEEILRLSEQSGRPILELEKEKLDCSHADLGGWLLKSWNFPAPITEAVYFHHTPQHARKNPTLTAVIHLSDQLCELWGIGYDGDYKKLSLRDNTGWKILKKKHPRIGKLDMDRFILELHLEIERAKLFLSLIGE